MDQVPVWPLRLTQHAHTHTPHPHPDPTPLRYESGCRREEDINQHLIIIELQESSSAVLPFTDALPEVS